SFEYLIPEQFKKEIKVGLGVLVPFQNGLKVGYITSIKNSSTFKNHKNILQIIEEKPFFGKDSIKLARWISDYYLSGIGDAIRLFLPPGGSQKIIKIIYFNKIDESDLDLKEDEKEIIKMVKSETNGISIDKLKDKGKILERLLKRKVLGYLYKMQAPNIKPLKERFIKLKKKEGIEEFIKKSKSKKKKSILKMLLIRECMKWKDIKDETNCTLNQIRDLEKEGFVEVFLEVRYSEINTDFPEIDKKVEPKVYLVQGVTGSGKTELYLNAINEVLKKGKMTIMLVPEISLTPQLVNRFNQRFKHLVALIHSGLSSRERYDQWKAVHEGKYKIVIGTRSALFAPVKNLGLIILDEEHENSYKQN
ncbi:MAG: DEAD/DEAH box helicase, partial [Actinomycetia bacterium]|nr:DEAD/DEAH box helicase [Actinomycetes bacterium]